MTSCRPRPQATVRQAMARRFSEHSQASPVSTIKPTADTRESGKGGSGAEQLRLMGRTACSTIVGYQ